MPKSAAGGAGPQRPKVSVSSKGPTTVTVRGENKGTIAGTDFMKGLWSVFVGPYPPTEKLKTGMYQTASEVVREGLRLLRDHDVLKQRQMEELRQRIAIGTQQAERGEVVDGAEAFKRLRQRSDERRSRSS